MNFIMYLLKSISFSVIFLFCSFVFVLVSESAVRIMIKDIKNDLVLFIVTRVLKDPEKRWKSGIIGFIILIFCILFCVYGQKYPGFELKDKRIFVPLLCMLLAGAFGTFLLFLQIIYVIGRLYMNIILRYIKHYSISDYELEDIELKFYGSSIVISSILTYCISYFRYYSNNLLFPIIPTLIILIIGPIIFLMLRKFKVIKNQVHSLN